MIAPHILALSAFLSLFWGIYLAYTVADYREAVTRRHDMDRRKGDITRTFRRMLVALCLWSICFAYVFRTITVLAGVGDLWGSQVAFFAILGLNVPSSIYATITVVEEWRA